MFNHSRVSVGTANVLSVDVKRDDVLKICHAVITLKYMPYKTKRPWFLVFKVNNDDTAKSVVDVFTGFLYSNTLLDAEIIGLGSNLPFVDNIKYAFGFKSIHILEDNVKTLVPFKPKLLNI